MHPSHNNQKAIFVRIFLALLFFPVASCSNINTDTGIMRNISAADFVKGMGIGINIGNTLDRIWNGPATA
jgi:hypothetical protein